MFLPAAVARDASALGSRDLMRRQNPPQAHIDNAVEVENFLRPARIIGAYAVLSALYVALIASAYAVFAREALVNTTARNTGLFFVAAIVPLLIAVLFCVLRPRDPISLWLTSIARQWRIPVQLAAEDHTFKELLGDGDGLCIKLSLYYPAKLHSQEIKDQLYLYVNGALSRECSMRIKVPTLEQIEEAIEPALEIVGSERNILVLYPVVREVYKIQSDFNFHEGELESAEFWRTGT
jgi:hypothetical protein